MNSMIRCSLLASVLASGASCGGDNSLRRVGRGAEVCDGVDNDENGTVDDGLVPPGRCIARGVCQTEFDEVCAGAQGWTCRYPSPRYELRETTCDGLDNDCDGVIDPDPLCRPELCDGQDNNGNGRIDDGVRAPGQCRASGVCALGATESCAGARGWLCRYASPNFESVEATCDGLDNDCDGEADEGGVCRPTRLVLVDGYDGQVYRSLDEAATWTKAGRAGFSAPAIVSVARRSDGATVVTSTRGEILVSTDGGANWSALPAAPWSADAPQGGAAHFVSLATAPDGDLVGVSVHSGRDGLVYRSSDLGRSWRVAGTWPERTGMMTDVAVAPNGEVYVAHPPYLGGTVYRSSDRGATFARVGAYDPGPAGGVAVIRSDRTGTLFAVGNPEVTLYASKDRGATWSALGAWLNPRAVQAMTVDRRNRIFAASVKGPVLVSDDGGRALRAVGDWGTAASRDIICCSGWIGLVADE